MVIYDFHLVSVTFMPAEADAPLTVDANAVPARAVTCKGFQPVAGREGQVAEFPRSVELRQPAKRDALNLRRQPVVRPPLPHPLRLPAGKAGNH